MSKKGDSFRGDIKEKRGVVFFVFYFYLFIYLFLGGVKKEGNKEIKKARMKGCLTKLVVNFQHRAVKK